jgi:hypothetical protein
MRVRLSHVLWAAGVGYDERDLVALRGLISDRGKADSTHLRTAALNHQLSYALEKLGRHSEALRVLGDDAGGVPESIKDR